MIESSLPSWRNSIQRNSLISSSSRDVDVSSVGHFYFTAKSMMQIQWLCWQSFCFIIFTDAELFAQKLCIKYELSFKLSNMNPQYLFLYFNLCSNNQRVNFQTRGPPHFHCNYPFIRDVVSLNLVYFSTCDSFCNIRILG